MAHIGVQYLHIGAYVSLWALFMPYFSTPVAGGWVLWHYKLLLHEGLVAMFVFPSLAAILYALVYIRNLQGSIARIPACLAIVLGTLGLVITIATSNVLFTLFFGGMVDAAMGSGYYLTVAAHVATVIGGLVCFWWPPRPSHRGGGEILVTAGSWKNNRTNENKSGSASAKTLRRRAAASKTPPRLGSPSPPSRLPPPLSFSLATRVWFVCHMAALIAGQGFVLHAIYGDDLRSVHGGDSGAMPLGQRVQLPPGFTIEPYVTGLQDARSMALGPRGVLFVGTRNAGEGRVYAVVGREPDAHIYEIDRGLRAPNGVAFRHDPNGSGVGSLFVAEVSRLWRYDGIEEEVLEYHTSLMYPPLAGMEREGRAEQRSSRSRYRPLFPAPSKVLLRDDWPQDDHHGWKFIRFGPDGRLYVPVGAPCNVCERTDARYASIMAVNISHPTSALDTIYAHGVRNTVGFDWDSRSNMLWFTENGRDFASEDFPPDEVNVAVRAGQHFGFPYCFGANRPDPETNRGRGCRHFEAAATELAPHSAGLGARFYTGLMFPKKYRDAYFFAEHGSWNRRSPNLTGYQIKVYGRPVDLQQMYDGALLVSDDYAHCIYRIAYLAGDLPNQINS